MPLEQPFLPQSIELDRSTSENSSNRSDTPASDSWSVTRTCSESANASKLVLFLGEGGEEEAKARWPDATVAEIGDNEQRQADVVLLYNILQRVARAKAVEVARAAAASLRPGGALHLVTPSLDWAIREYFLGSGCPALPIILHGAQVDERSYYLSSWDIPSLRDVLGSAGIVIRGATVLPGRLTLRGANGEAKDEACAFNHVWGVKHVPNPA